MASGELVALAQAAGQAVVSAAASDTWDRVKQGVARILGRGDPGQTAIAERRLEDTRNKLTALSGEGLSAARASLELSWQVRLTDLLEDDPGVAADLRALIATIPVGSVAVGGHGAASGRDMTISAAGGVAAGTIHGNVTAPNPPQPGPAAS